MSELDYTKLPFYEELQTKIRSGELPLNESFQIDDVRFLSTRDILGKLSYPSKGEARLFSSHQIRHYLAQTWVEEGDYEDFLAPTALEAKLLDYYLHVCQTPLTLMALNQDHDDALSSERLGELFGLDEGQTARVYYIRVCDSWLPEDQISLCFEGVSKDKIHAIAENINRTVDYHCNCIVHQECIEMYGILKDMMERLVQFNES